MLDTFLIVDGNSLMHRAFHALPLMDAEGIYTNAIYGFLNMLLKVIKEQDVRYIAVCFDEHGPTFRHQAYAEYKAGRSATPPELRQQFETIRQLLSDMGVRWYAMEGWEADDLLGTISRLGVQAGVAPLLLTGDRDALQLVGDGTELMFTRKGISETTRFTPATVHEEYGFSPEQVTDWKGLAGDSSDNIPGIPGVGDKTAVKLLQQYGTLENVLEHAGEVKGKLGEKLVAWADQARMCKELATIRRDAPIGWKLSDCAIPDFTSAIPALKKLRLNAIIRRISEEAGDQAAANAEADKPVLLAFQEVTVIDAPDALTAWLADVPEAARPLALYLTDEALSLAGQDGRCCQAVLGGDLLNPGLDPVAALATVAPDIAAHETVVHDGKRLLHTLRKLGLNQPETFAWDAMLGAYLINPQERSYSFAALRGELPEDARGLMSLAAWQRKKIEADQMTHLMRDVEMPLSLVLYRMEEIGFTVDTAFLKQLGERYVAEIEDCKAQVYKACGGKPFNLNSPQQLGTVLFEELKLPHGRKTQRG